MAIREEYVVSAIEVLVSFCDKYKVKIGSDIIARFAIAWREDRSFEWTPCEAGFRRIISSAWARTDGKDLFVAQVFKGCDYDSESIEMTDELNLLISRSTDNRWEN